MSENDSRTALLVHTHGTPVSIRPSRQREAASGRQVEGHGQLRTRHGLSGELSGELSRSYPLQVRAKHRYTVAVPAPLRISRVKVVVNDILTARRVRQTLRESRDSIFSGSPTRQAKIFQLSRVRCLSSPRPHDRYPSPIMLLDTRQPRDGRFRRAAAVSLPLSLSLASIRLPCPPPSPPRCYVPSPCRRTRFPMSSCHRGWSELVRSAAWVQRERLARRLNSRCPPTRMLSLFPGR